MSHTLKKMFFILEELQILNISFILKSILCALVTHLVERAPLVLRLSPCCSGLGSIPTHGPLLHVIPLSLPLSCLKLSYPIKAKKPKNNLLNINIKFKVAMVTTLLILSRVFYLVVVNQL